MIINQQENNIIHLTASTRQILETHSSEADFQLSHK